GDSFALSLGARWLEPNSYSPSYFRPGVAVKGLPEASYVMYGAGQRIELASGGVAHGARENPYFNRDVFTFCSHQHTPSTLTSDGPGMTAGEHGMYFAWNVFEDYATKGSLVLRESVLYALDQLLAQRRTLRTNLPAQGVVTLQKQAEERRWVA